MGPNARGIDLRGTRSDAAPAPATVFQRQGPVLPPGWAPLTRDQQVAVLQACDRAPGALVFRMGAADPHLEYRVYRLDEAWAGLCVASVCETPTNGLPPTNCELLALASADVQAVAIVVSRVNAELLSSGGTFRLQLSAPAVQPEDPRRV